MTRRRDNGGVHHRRAQEIEEIRINTIDPTAPGGTGPGDTFEIIGDFSGTSLRLNTITIDGQAGDDTVDITSLEFGASHRVQVEWRA